MTVTEKDLARLASFPEQNPNPVIEISLAGEVTYLNPASQKYFPDIQYRLLQHPLFDKVRDRLSVQDDFQCEVELEDRIFEQKIFFLPNTGLARIYSTDITEIKSAQKNLARLATFPEQNPSPIIEINLEGKMTYHNPACLLHFPRFKESGMEHAVLDYFRENFSKFLSGELVNYSVEIKAGEKYFAQRAKLLHEYGVIRIFNIDISEQKRNEEIIRRKNKDITDSINYAKKIQDAILPPREILHFHFQDAFILYIPKDIISGDFYWFSEVDDVFVIASADCTGHGVPGALMSMIGSNLISQIVTDSKVQSPGAALTELDRRIRKSLNQDMDVPDATRDGMDIALCAIHKRTGVLQYAGAHRPLLLVQHDELREIAPSKFPIGGQSYGLEKSFADHEMKLEDGDSIYLYSDGIVDQFGGPRGKKVTKKYFYEMIRQIRHLHMYEQKEKLRLFFEEWKGDLEQLDDVLVIGFRYKKG